MLLRKAVQLARMYRTPWRSIASLERLRQHRLRRTLEHACRRVPCYQRLAAESGLRLADLSAPDALQALPVTAKADLRARAPNDRIAAGTRPDSVVTLHTSGTTGEIEDIPCDRVAIDLRGAAITRSLLHVGYRLTDRIATQTPSTTPASLRPPRVPRRSEIMFNRPIEEQLAQLAELRPRIIEGYASWVEQIAVAALATGLSLQPAVVVTTSEVLTEAMRDRIRQAFGVAPIDQYSCWEVGLIAWQCRERRGMHVNADLMEVEILRPDGTHAEPDELGAVVITDFQNRAAPLLRYDIGDLAALSSEPCACGRGLPLLTRVDGRRNDVLIRADGSTVMATTVLAGVMREVSGVAAYQARQGRRGEMNLLVEADPRFRAADERRLAARLAGTFQLERVRIERTDRIEPGAGGKRRSVVPLSETAVR